jgi:hypothetical protein
MIVENMRYFKEVFVKYVHTLITFQPFRNLFRCRFGGDVYLNIGARDVKSLYGYKP